MMLTVAGATAQKNVEREMKALIDDASVTKVQSENYDYPDDAAPSTFCHYTALQLTKKQAVKLDKLKEAFLKDSNNGYNYTYMTPQMPATATNLVYGPDLEYNVQFFSHKNHNYLLLLVDDKNKAEKRYAYAIAWYEYAGGIRCMLYTIYGDKPKRKADNKKSPYKTAYLDALSKINGFDQTTTTTTTTTIVDGKDVTVVTSGGNAVPTYTAPTNDIEFMTQFGNLRVAFLDAIKDSEKKSLQTGIAIKILELCKNHKKVLNKNQEEINACVSGLGEMMNIARKTINDNFINGTLAAALNSLQR